MDTDYRADDPDHIWVRFNRLAFLRADERKAIEDARTAVDLTLNEIREALESERDRAESAPRGGTLPGAGQRNGYLRGLDFALALVARERHPV